MARLEVEVCHLAHCRKSDFRQIQSFPNIIVGRIQASCPKLWYNNIFQRTMSILEGVRAANIKGDKPKFVIKSRTNLKDNREEVQYQTVTATDEDAFQFIEYMINKSTRLGELLDKKTIINESKFYEKHLFGSICLKTMLKQILDKMMADRRLGKNLKGMNKSNLVEVENCIWSVVEREANLYLNELEYTNKKRQLENDLKIRKEQLREQIEKISSNRARRDSEDVVALGSNQI